MTKISDSDSTPAAARTTTAAAPVSDVSMAGTVGGRDAEVRETVGKEV